MINNTILKKTITIIFFLNTVSCSTDNIIHKPTIIQGNYFNEHDLIKIHHGLKKNIVLSILGSPTLKDPFESNTYYYIFFKKTYKKKTIQNTLTLIFDNCDNLISIKYKKL